MGRETYLANLIRHLLHIDRENEYVLYVSARDVVEGLKEAREGQVEFRVIRPRSSILQRTALIPIALHRDGVDIFYLHTLGIPFFSGKTVLAVHGISGLWSASLGTRLLLRAMLPWSLRSASRIIANSEYTQREITAEYGVPPDRIRVVHGGVNQMVFCQDLNTRDTLEYAPVGPYCLYLGAIEARKNLTRLIEAVAVAGRRLGHPPSVVIAGIPRGPGGTRYLNHLQSVVRDRGLSDAVRFVGYVDPASAARLLRRAAFLVFPSLQESFGLPPLEAMACGTPVLASRIGSLPEVLGDAPLWCDPQDVAAIADGICRLATDQSLRSLLIQRGRERAACFTWEAAAAKTLQVFREAANTDPQGLGPGSRG